MVLVMDGQFLQFFAGKIPAALRADPRVDLQRLISVIFLHSLILRPSAEK
jgi:hypothetical protein